MKKQAHIYYSGRVQGVGFRFTVERLAGELDIAGWVKNLDDGRVEIVAEAEEKDLQEFLAKIKQHLSRYIKEVDIEWLKASGEFKDFAIEF